MILICESNRETFGSPELEYKARECATGRITIYRGLPDYCDRAGAD
jgi:hypothetical protein